MTPNPPPPPLPPMPARAPGATGPTNPFAVAALIVAIVGICAPCLGPLAAVILGVVALLKIKGTPQQGLPLAIAALAISAFIAIAHVGMVAAIAIPNFIKFQARSRQAECKTNLRALHTAQSAFFAEKDRYSEDPAELGFVPAKPQRYSYFLSTDPSGWVLGDKDAPQQPDLELIEVGIEGECPDCSYTAMCSGNVDGDPGLDVWVISSEVLDSPDGESHAAGEPHNMEPDVSSASSRRGGSDWDD